MVRRDQLYIAKDTLSCTRSLANVGRVLCETRASTAVLRPSLLALFYHALAKELWLWKKSTQRLRRLRLRLPPPLRMGRSACVSLAYCPSTERVHWNAQPDRLAESAFLNAEQDCRSCRSFCRKRPQDICVVVLAYACAYAVSNAPCA